MRKILREFLSQKLLDTSYQFVPSIKLASLIMIFILSGSLTAGQNKNRYFSHDSKPYARYWWFASMIEKQDVKYNLNWLKSNGFGGVELAWVYPLNRFNPDDTSYTPRQEWLSKEWSEIVDFTIKYADSIGLGCDMTFGTLWPFGDSYVKFEEATQKFGAPDWRQEISLTWQHPKKGYVIDHLTPKNYKPYFERLLSAFPHPKTGIKQNYFIDSWEVETEKLWCYGFEKDFTEKFGYDISPYMDSIYVPVNKHYLYDYMSLLSEKVLKFYSDFDSALNSNGIASRGQISGAPCDLISGYALMDIPEGESMLFEPEFCAIPASAALLSGKKYVSSETFTCLYGWPRDYIREEQIADLKLVADALFANGINQLIWHGKAHNPAGEDTVNFYATTHIGKNCMMQPEIGAFNQYLSTVSKYMQKGFTFGDIAVYLPTEDAWLAGVMPLEKQFKWAWGYYEMRYIYFPEELDAYNPVWINGEFLEKSMMKDGFLKIGDAQFKALFIDADFIEYKVIKSLLKLADQGLKIILKKIPREPGAVKNPDYNDLVDQLKNNKNITDHLPENIIPFISGDNIPRHWCRKDGDAVYIYFPNPKSERLKFPLEYGQSLCTEKKELKITIHYEGEQIPLDLVFEPYQSLLYKIEKGKPEQIDIKFIPRKPLVKKRPDDYQAPWLVK